MFLSVSNALATTAMEISVKDCNAQLGQVTGNFSVGSFIAFSLPRVDWHAALGRPRMGGVRKPLPGLHMSSVSLVTPTFVGRQLSVVGDAAPLPGNLSEVFPAVYVEYQMGS